jgi:hypothetical protein
VTPLIPVTPYFIQAAFPAAYTYDDLARRSNLTYTNGAYANYNYDTAGRVLYVDNQTNNGQHKYAYTYDYVGNRGTMQVTDSNGSRTTVYTYDATYQSEWGGRDSLFTTALWREPPRGRELGGFGLQGHHFKMSAEFALAMAGSPSLLGSVLYWLPVRRRLVPPCTRRQQHRREKRLFERAYHCAVVVPMGLPVASNCV